MSLKRDGYSVLDLPPEVTHYIRRVVESIEEKFVWLPNYKEHDLDAHARTAGICSGIPKQAILCEIDYFRSILGGDIHIQRKPYLRISRPGEGKDNIGYHRDTWYGDTPYELSVWIPLTDTDEGNCLYVKPGSHIAPESAYPTKRISRPDVKKGGKKHSLGFIYDPPKALSKPVKMTPVPVKVGQMIVFPLSLLHGQEINRSQYTRFSIDCRLANSLAPVKWARSRAKEYYEPLCSTEISDIAKAYYKANERNIPKQQRD